MLLLVKERGKKYSKSGACYSNSWRLHYQVEKEANYTAKFLLRITVTKSTIYSSTTVWLPAVEKGAIYSNSDACTSI
jgi:hypothetical protein